MKLYCTGFSEYKVVQWRLSRKNTIITIRQEFEEDFKSALNMTKKRGRCMTCLLDTGITVKTLIERNMSTSSTKTKYKPCVPHTSFENVQFLDSLLQLVSVSPSEYKILVCLCECIKCSHLLLIIISR
jgi:hypothetical protein